MNSSPATARFCVNLEALIILSASLIPLLARIHDPALINVSSGLGFVPMA